MRKLLKYGWLVGMCVLFSSGLAVADDIVPPVAEDMAPAVSQHNLEVGLVSSYFEYKEPNEDVKIDGFLYGIIGSYTRHDKNKLMVHASFELNHGSLEYDGWLLDIWDGSREPIKDDSRDWIIEGRFLVGHDRFLGGPRGYHRHLITPYIGLGLRYWHNDIEGRGGYAREVTYWYLPIGIKTESRLSDNWKWRMNAEYDFFLGGRVKSYLSDVNYGYNDPVVDQDFGEGHGLRCSLGFTRKLHKIYTLSIEPYITYWDIKKTGKSHLTFYGLPFGVVWEPANKTTSYGLRISLAF